MFCLTACFRPSSRGFRIPFDPSTSNDEQTLAMPSTTQRLANFYLTAFANRAELNPFVLQRFAAVIMRVRQPKTTALIFASGKMVVTGAKSEDDSRLAARKYARIIQKLGFEAQFTEFKIQNMVGSCDVKFPIRLEGLAFSHGHFSSYEPEVSIFLIWLFLWERTGHADLILALFSAVPWSHLPYGQAKGRSAHLRLWQSRLNGCKGD